MKKIFLFIFILLAYSYAFANEWIWQYPNPQGNTLNKVSFYTSYYGYAIGDNGTILFTSDMGASWDSQNQGYSDDLRDISLADSITGWAVGDNGLILNTIDGGSNWNEQNSNVTVGLNAVYFIDSQIGWACGDSKTLIKTTDGGKTWIPVQIFIVPTLVSFNDIYFSNVNNGWIVGSGGFILKTTNAGLKWTEVQTTGQNLYSVKSDNNGLVLAGGDIGIIEISTDFGTTWKISQSNKDYGVNELVINNLNDIWAACDNGVILHSINSGKNWVLDSTGSYASVYGIESVDNTLYLSGEYGFIAKQIQNQKISFINSGMFDSNNWFAFSDDINGFCVGQYGSILKTTNGGQSWITVNNGITGDSFFGAHAIGSNVWVVGDLGVILFSSDAGSKWIQQSSNTLNTLESICFINQNEGWCAGNAGQILHTTDGGNNWLSQTSGTKNVIFGIKFYDQLHGIFVGDLGTIYKTINGGQTWQPVKSNTNYAIYNVDFINQNIAYAGGSSGIILKTTDGGSSWKTLNTGTTVPLYIVQGVSENAVWAVGDSGTVLKSTDAGNSWLPETQFTGYDMFGLKVFSDSLAWVCGDNGTIMQTGTPIINKQKVLKLLSPAGGEKYLAKSSQLIKWNSQNLGNLEILISTDNQQSWYGIKSSVNSTLDSVSWVIPDVQSDHCFMIIDEYTDSVPNILDMNKIPFSIYQQINPKSLKLMTPSGGEKWVVNSNHTITWAENNVNNIKIEFSFDNQKSWNLINSSLPAANNNFSWQIPDNLSDSCFIRISDNDTDTVSSLNKTAFSISKGTGINEGFSFNQDNITVTQSIDGCEIVLKIKENVELFELSISDILGNNLINLNGISNKILVLNNYFNPKPGVYFCKVEFIDNFNHLKNTSFVKFLVY